MLLSLARQRRLLFVGGKGGVGKTTVASALALARAREGARVLLVSTDPAHNLGHLWERTIGDRAARLLSTPGPGLVDGVEIDPRATVERHLAAVGRTMRQLLPERLHAQAQRHLELAGHAPGSHESAVLERVAESAQLGLASYDLVVFDTAPSGHTLRLLSLPGQLTGWAENLLASRARSERFAAALRSLGGSPAGPGQTAAEEQLLATLRRRRDRFAGLRDALSDAHLAGFVLVTVPEPLPVAETVLLAGRLREIGVDPAGLIVNRRAPVLPGRDPGERWAREAVQVSRLRREVPRIPLAELPAIDGHLLGEAAIQRFAARLAGAAPGAAAGAIG